MEKYITPLIRRYHNIDDLFVNSNKAHSLSNAERKLSIEELLKDDFVCIIGEPGIGKSRLIDEIMKHPCKKNIHFCKASEFKNESISKNIEYYIIDALDEVKGDTFYSTLQQIKNYKDNNPNTKVLFTCRKHYVASYKNHFSSCNDLIYVELCRLRGEDVLNVINKYPDTIKSSVGNNSKLRELLTIPRYLTFFEEYEEQKGNISNINELFEYIISKSILKAIEARDDGRKNESLKILIQRVLEKVAFIMEISRKDQISKDELYTIFDGAKGNMTQMFVSNFDLLFFENRILKDTNGYLKFENTELQEYLAAKELCRHDNIESILYDIAVQKDLKHIYLNWYDVIPHISYTKDRVHSFINIIKLIVSYESCLENESFESLLRYIDSSILSSQQKKELFSIILNHYLRVPTSLYWKTPILKLMQKCYTSNCNSELKPSTEHVKQFNKIQLANICAILGGIVEEDKLNKDIYDYWTSLADILIQEDDEEKKKAALNLYKVLKAWDKLTHLSKEYSVFSKKLKERYCEVTGHGEITDKAVVDCWLDGCMGNSPYAINAVLNIKSPSTITYAYKSIIEANKLNAFFDPRGEMSVFYEPYLNKQFNIIWNEDSEKKEIITKIIANYVKRDSYSILHEIDATIKQIILDDKMGKVFIECFEEEWNLADIFKNIDEKIVDAELISTLDKLLNVSKVKKFYIDMILTTLINKIRNDEVKSLSVSEYISRYAETLAQWDKNSEETVKKENDDSSFILAYQSLAEPNVSKYEKYNAAYRLSKNINFLQEQDSKPFVDVIETFIDEMNLDKLKLEKKENNTFSISTMLVMLPYFVRAMYHLNFHDILKKYRLVLAKTLPFVRCTSFYDYNEIQNIYKSIIGHINKEEKERLIVWWKSRKDDLMNISPDSVLTCITDYNFDALSYKLEEYIEEYKKNQDIEHRFAASKALELISTGYGDWNIENYKCLFNALNDDNIESVKMQCNATMIEKYQDAEAIRWRIEYLKDHVVPSIHNTTGHARFISIEESEMTSPNPSMFRCFMNIKNNEVLDNQMLELFDFGLSLCNVPDRHEYASYLLKQIYDFFLETDNSYISVLRKKVESFNTKNASFLANNIMNNAEMTFLNKEKISIEKAIKMYNKCIEESHLEIRNDGDMRRYFTYIHSEVQKEIQDQGIYSLIKRDVLNEDFIQRELKNAIINKCYKLGLNAIQVDREVALQDNKRTDLLIRYGFCNPIMVELKLLHNDEIQNERKRQEYKKKFIKYKNATNACLSIFWVFDVHHNGSDITKFKNLEEEYKNLENTRVLLTDCKCSSGIDTGMPKKKKTPKLKNTPKRGKTKRR